MLIVGGGSKARPFPRITHTSAGTTTCTCTARGTMAPAAGPGGSKTWCARLSLAGASFRQHSCHQIPQRAGEVRLADDDHMVIHPEVVDGAARGRPVGRGESRCPADKVFPAPGIAAAGGVEHPPAHAGGRDLGDYEQHLASVSPCRGIRTPARIVSTCRRPRAAGRQPGHGRPAPSRSRGLCANGRQPPIRCLPRVSPGAAPPRQ